MSVDAISTQESGASRAALQDWAGAAGRVLIAAIFVLSGVAKVTAPAGNIAYIQSAGLPFPELALAAAIVVELIGGAVLIAGFKTRWVAGALAAFSVVTALAFHNNLADQNQFIHFFKNLALAGGLLQLVAFGAGRVSVDRR